MTQTLTATRAFEPGTTGWTVEDLNDRDTQWRWSEGRYELVDGVLTIMPPQGFQGVRPLGRLHTMLQRALDAAGRKGCFYHEVDVLLRRRRLPRPDMIYLTEAQEEEQEELEAKRNLAADDYRPVYVSPELVVESVSVGHEDHDRVTKREWYAAAGIPHYWLLTAHERSLVCLTFTGAEYVEEASGRDEQIVRTRAFGGLDIPLSELWSRKR